MGCHDVAVWGEIDWEIGKHGGERLEFLFGLECEGYLWIGWDWLLGFGSIRVRVRGGLRWAIFLVGGFGLACWLASFVWITSFLYLYARFYSLSKTAMIYNYKHKLNNGTAFDKNSLTAQPLIPHPQHLHNNRFRSSAPSGPPQRPHHKLQSIHIGSPEGKLHANLITYSKSSKRHIL